MSKQLVAMEKADERKEAAYRCYEDANWTYLDRARIYLKAEGWVEESRYDGNGGMFGSIQRVYRRPTGSRWHTLRGALEKQRRRARQARKKVR